MSRFTDGVEMNEHSWCPPWTLLDPYDALMFCSGAFVLGAVMGAAIQCRLRTFVLFWLVAGPIIAWQRPWLQSLGIPSYAPMFWGAFVFGFIFGNCVSGLIHKCPKCGKLNAMRRDGNIIFNFLRDVIPPRPAQEKRICQHCGFNQWVEVDDAD